jgi:LacI family transcriptional regulator
MLNGESVEPVVMVPPAGVIDRGSTRLAGSYDPLVTKAQDLMQVHLGSPLQMPEMCRRLGISERSLQRRFQKAFGHSPVTELNRIRVNHAKELLVRTRLSVSQIADRCGYAETSQLSRAIRQHTGISPMQFRTHALYERGAAPV